MRTGRALAPPFSIRRRDMNDGKFWINIWSIIAVVVIVIVAGGYLYHNNKNKMIVSMIAGGTDPMEASLAVSQMSMSDYMGHTMMAQAKSAGK